VTTPSPLILPFDGKRPILAPGAWIAPGAVVLGDVEIGEDSSVWFGSVVRGDIHSIRIGARTNLQDHCVVHVTRGRFSTTIGDEVTVGHRGTVHGCVVHDGALVGIGATVLDGAVIAKKRWSEPAPSCRPAWRCRPAPSSAASPPASRANSRPKRSPPNANEPAST